MYLLRSGNNTTILILKKKKKNFENTSFASHFVVLLDLPSMADRIAHLQKNNNK
jgi:hypothetical protein